MMENDIQIDFNKSHTSDTLFPNLKENMRLPAIGHSNEIQIDSKSSQAINRP